MGVSDLRARGKNAMLIKLYFRILCCPWTHIVIITNLILNYYFMLFVDYVFNYFVYAAAAMDRVVTAAEKTTIN